MFTTPPLLNPLAGVSEYAGTATDVARVPDLLADVVALDRKLAVLVARRARAVHLFRLAELAVVGAGDRGVGERSVRLELAAALRVTENTAGDTLALAEALVERYPLALASLEHGAVSERHVRVLVELVDTVSPADRGTLEAEAVGWAEELAVGPFRRRMKRRVDALRAETLAERHESAVAQRCVFVDHREDGMASLVAVIPAVEAHAIFGRLTAMGKRLTEREGEERTLDQVRADILGDLLIDGDSRALPDGARGIVATVNVTVPALTLLDPAEPGSGRSRYGRAGVAEVEGLGPVPRERAVQLCGGADGWMRILTDPESGVVLSVGRTLYRPPAALRRLVRWRADRCMAPGCGMPANRCEIDHTVAWEDGGRTSVDNLAPLCKGHHTIKHHGGWRVRQIRGDGTLEWRSPAGRTYTVAPRRPTPAVVFRDSESIPSGVPEPPPPGNPPF